VDMDAGIVMEPHVLHRFFRFRRRKPERCLLCDHVGASISS
jgi:hypothetical protein